MKENMGKDNDGYYYSNTSSSSSASSSASSSSSDSSSDSSGSSDESSASDTREDGLSVKEMYHACRYNNCSYLGPVFTDPKKLYAFHKADPKKVVLCARVRRRGKDGFVNVVAGPIDQCEKMQVLCSDCFNTYKLNSYNSHIARCKGQKKKLKKKKKKKKKDKGRVCAVHLIVLFLSLQ